MADEGLLKVVRGEDAVAVLKPQKRLYTASRNVSTEMAIDAGFFRDLFVTLGEHRGAGAWSMSFYIKPFVRWVWLGTLLMAFGGFIAATDRRYRKARHAKSARLSVDHIPAAGQWVGGADRQ